MEAPYTRPRDLVAERAVISGLTFGADLDAVGLQIEHFAADLRPLVETIVARGTAGLPVDRRILELVASEHAELVRSLPRHDPSQFTANVTIVRDLSLLRRLLDACEQVTEVLIANPPVVNHDVSSRPSRLRVRGRRRR